MKKILLGTTALVVAAVAAASAPAIAQTAPAAGVTTTSGFAVTIGGYARQYVSYVNQTNTAPALKNNSVDQNSDNRLILSFRQALPSGMSAGAVWQINPNASTAIGNSITRRMWSFAEGQFGQVQLGGADSVVAQSLVTSFEAFTGGFVVGDSTSVKNSTTRAGVLLLTGDGAPASATDVDGIANKIVYYTPRIEGFQVGFNYTPEAAYRQGVPTSNVQYLNGWAAVATYVNTIAGVAVRSSVGYLTWDKPSHVGLTDAVRASNNATPKLWNAGLGLRYMGFDLGGSYSNLKDFRNATNGTTTTAGALGTRTVDGNVWDIGLGYIFGPASVSINYTEATNEDAAFSAAGVKTVQAGDDKAKIVGISGSYTLAPGVTANVGAFTAKYSEGTTNTGANANLFGTAQSSTATGVVTGLTLAF
jgi:outer membrane protein OmpU